MFTGFNEKGLRAGAIELILKYVFEKLKLHQIEANVELENKVSIAVLKRTDFSKEGFSRKYIKIGRRWRDQEDGRS